MSIKIKGTNKLIQELERKFDRENIKRISDEGLKHGAKIFVAEMTSQIKSAGDKGYAKGYTVDEITVDDPVWGDGGNREIKVHWKGPHDRYRLIHLNEFGTIKIPNPPRKGAIARALRNSEKAYAAAIREALRRGI